MTDLRTAAQQALEACTDAVSGWQSLAPLAVRRAAEESLDALRTALAEPVQEPVQEPVAWRYKPMVGSPWSLADDGYYISCKRDSGYIIEPLYTAPPQRKPLTDETLWEMWVESPSDVLRFARAIERAHGI